MSMGCDDGFSVGGIIIALHQEVEQVTPMQHEVQTPKPQTPSPVLASTGPSAMVPAFVAGILSLVGGILIKLRVLFR